MIPIWLSHMWHSYMNHKCSQVRNMTFIWYTYMITIYDTHIRLAKRLQVPQTQFIWYTHMIHTYDTHIWYSYTMSKRSQVQEMTFIWYTHMMPIYDTYIRWVKDLHHKYERRHLYDTHIWLSYIDHLIKKMFLHVYDPHMHVPYITLIYEPQMITSTKDHIHMIHTYDTHIWYSYTMSKRSQVQEMTFIWYTHMMPIYDTYIRWVKDLHHKYERRHLYDTHIWLSYIDHLIKKMFLHVYDPHMHVPYITLIYEPQMITSTKGHIHMIHTYDTPMWYTHMILIYSYCTNNFIYMIHMWWSHI